MRGLFLAALACLVSLIAGRRLELVLSAGDDCGAACCCKPAAEPSCCADERRCHRSILASILLEHGAQLV